MTLAYFIVFFFLLVVLIVGVWSVGATPSAHLVLLQFINILLSISCQKKKKTCKAKPFLSTKLNPPPLLSTLLTKCRTYTLSQKQIQAISQKAYKGMTMGANIFNIRPNLHIRAFSLGISQLIYEKTLFLLSLIRFFLSI